MTSETKRIRRSNDGGAGDPWHVMNVRLHRYSRLSAWRFRPCALLLSAGAHVVLFTTLCGDVTGKADLPGLNPAAAVTVHLKAAPTAAVAVGQAGAIPPSPPHADHAADTHAHAYTERTVDLPKAHYFESAEWADAPVLVQDIASDQLLVSPRLTATPLLITLFINEQGGIDKVEIGGTPLPDFEKQLVGIAFARARFHPARAGGLAVKSRLNIELRLENSRSDPAPAEGSAAMPSI